MCVLCVMYIVVQVVSCTGTSLLVTDSYPHSMPCISNEYLPIHHIACSTLALFSALDHLQVGHFQYVVLACVRSGQMTSSMYDAGQRGQWCQI